VNGDQVFIEFTDSGPGVQDASRVFDPFYTTKPVGKGTGLGLSICYGIITEHGGTIRVRNQATKGASFIIELPFPAATQFLRTKVSAVTAQRNDKKILLASTDRAVLESVEQFLRSANYSVTAVNNIDDAKTVLEKGQFGLVIADGDLISAICDNKSAGPEATTMLVDRLIVISDSQNPAGNAATTSSLGTGRILHKPIQAAELLSLLEELLNRVHASTTEG
jgi:two-component system NtrC family sensor kinase